ncbi:hypothetical protein ASV53_01110 [Photobacterium sanguinicancri]|uniref:Uncharacterized protein n=1 Tax=Photobacterium sanguinicancri TaxID=875932 RepID=A0ABX4G3Q0_9GAMM|nr:hypothetical protein ASV53_01110 [Photobacterium sanguinicancri]
MRCKKSKKRQKETKRKRKVGIKNTFPQLTVLSVYVLFLSVIAMLIHNQTTKIKTKNTKIQPLRPDLDIYLQGGRLLTTSQIEREIKAL